MAGFIFVLSPVHTVRYQLRLRLMQVIGDIAPCRGVRMMRHSVGLIEFVDCSSRI